MFPYNVPIISFLIYAIKCFNDCEDSFSTIVVEVLFNIKINLYMSECLGNSCTILGVCLLGFPSE